MRFYWSYKHDRQKNNLLKKTAYYYVLKKKLLIINTIFINNFRFLKIDENFLFQILQTYTAAIEIELNFK